MTSESRYGVPIKKKWAIHKKQLVLSELKGNYIDSQARSLVIVTQPTILVSSSLLLAQSIFRRKIYVKSSCD